MTRSIAALLIILVGFLGCATDSDKTTTSERTTVILGTCTWEVESNNNREPSDSADFWWEHATETERYLVPKYGAKVAVITEEDFDKIDASFIEAQNLSEEKISASDENGVLNPGAIVAFKTAEGNPGVLQVVGYRGLHDFSFPEVAYLPEEFRDLALNSPNIERYHLIVKWRLCK